MTAGHTNLEPKVQLGLGHTNQGSKVTLGLGKIIQD